METSKLKKFAQYARRSLIEQVSNKLKMVLAKDSAARRESAEAVEKLEKQIQAHGREQVIEKVAYIWFNRFCALRFMDVNRYTRIGVVSPAEGQFQPEILAEAKMGHIDEGMVDESARQRIFALLDGKTPSQDPQAEAYRLLVVAICNYWHGSMPFMFERIADYTELLMPDDLLSGNSILAYTREAMTPDVCEDVEVIGWLYQFYISEKKDEVFDGLKKNKKITPENIPAATQLFTPHWIVRYLVENSLGRLWMLNRSDSRLVEQMDYYIKPEPRMDTNGHEIKEDEIISVDSCSLVVKTPEEIKICDPACGSGHMLTYAFDLLYAIYEEEGYEPAEIPEKILTHNLYGIEIDERAGELAAFALTMKARAKQRRFFRKQVQPNICVLENIDGTTNEHEWTQIVDVMVQAGVDRETLLHGLGLFTEADNFGSLLRPQLSAEQAQKALDALLAYDQSVKAPTFGHQKIVNNCKQALRQADYLSPKYHVVVANPPYMGGKGMNGRLAAWLKDNYADVKSDLFSAFIARNTELALPKGQLGFMSPFVWMFISSYEKLRSFLINRKTITSLVQLEYSGFEGATVPICTFTVENNHKPDFKGGYIRLSDFRGSDNQAPKTLEAIKNPDCGWFYRSAAVDFKKIPGSPIAYWLSPRIFEIFQDGDPLREFSKGSTGLQTSDGATFVRLCHEPAISTVGKKWIRFAKGGRFRKWYGNVEHLVNWEDDGAAIKEYVATKYPYLKGNYALVVKNESTYFLEGLLTSRVTSGSLSFRAKSKGEIYADACTAIFPKEQLFFLSLLSTKLLRVVQELNPTLNFQASDIEKFPIIKDSFNASYRTIAQRCIELSKADWDSYETSLDFTSLPLLNPDYRQSTLKATYQKLRAHWHEMTLEMQRLEQENNRIFIDAYGLQGELTPEVPLSEITLTCNPHYRYNGDKSEDELEALLLADTMKEFVTYAVGCMFGRYALDKPGLILANQGEAIDDYYKKLQEPRIDTNKHEVKEKNISVNSCSLVVPNSFPADDDNVIPILDGNWFTDDITERFYKFLRVTFGEEHYEENLKFIEQAIGKDIRKYFLKDFYADYVKRYKKRPIYWLFSSPKGSFNALIYMHRYRPDTVSVVLNDYLREFRAKLASRKDHLEAVSISASATAGEKTRALKEIEKINKMIAEMEEYERDVLYPLATEQVEIDLDDGVKVNYNKFGKALKKVPGLSR